MWKFDKYFVKFVELLGTVATMVLFALMVMQVILRYVFGFSPLFTEEFGRYILVWSVLAGAAVSVRQGLHIKIEFLQDLLPQRVRSVWLIILDAMCLVLFIMLVYYGVDMTLYGRNQTSSGLQIPMFYYYMAFPFFFACACFFAVARFLERRRK